jgi:hypothetical protein
MYNFERRLERVEKAYKDISTPRASNTPSAIENIEDFVMLARTVTFVMQKELDTHVGFGGVLST